MGCSSLLLIKTFVLLWIISVVADSELRKRDVHRIILKERRPRSHKRGHRHISDNHYHHHHNKHHSHDEGHKKGKRHYNHENDHSYEDEDVSHSRENHVKNHKKTYGHHKQQRRPSPVYLKNYNSDESKSEMYNEDTKLNAFREEWTPLLHSDNSFGHSFENNRFKSRKPRRESKKHYNKYPVNIDITTSFPQTIPFSAFQPTVYPPLSHFTNFNPKFIDPNQSPLIGTIEQFQFVTQSSKQNDRNINKQLTLDHTPNPSNHKSNYEVHESNNEGDGIPDPLTIQALLPLINVAKNQLAVGASTVVEKTQPLNQTDVNTNVVTKKPSRVRMTRGKNKF